MPTSFSKFVDLTIVTGSAVATAVGSFAQNAYASLSGNKEVGCNEEISLLHRPFLTPCLTEFLFIFDNALEKCTIRISCF